MNKMRPSRWETFLYVQCSAVHFVHACAWAAQIDVFSICYCFVAGVGSCLFRGFFLKLFSQMKKSTIFRSFLTRPDISTINISLAYQQSMSRCDRVGLARINYNCCVDRFASLFTCDLFVMVHNFWWDVFSVLSHELSRCWRNVKLSPTINSPLIILASITIRFMHCPLPKSPLSIHAGRTPNLWSPQTLCRSTLSVRIRLSGPWMAWFITNCRQKTNYWRL